jgi:hypothetical protein
MNVTIRQPRQLKLWHKLKRRRTDGVKSFQWFTTMNLSHKSYHFSVGISHHISDISVHIPQFKR